MVLTGNLLQNSLKLFGLVLIFVLIIVACYYVTRFVGSRNVGAMRENNIKLIDMYRINQNQCILIVCVGSRYFLLASGKDSVSMLSELEKDDLQALPMNSGKPIRFQDIFASFNKKQEETPVNTEKDKNNL